MEEDFEDDLAEEGLPTGHDAVAPGKGILLLPHRHLHPHSQLLKARPSVDQEPRIAIMPPHATHSHLGGQDHGEWTYEEQFRQVGGRHTSRSPASPQRLMKMIIFIWFDLMQMICLGWLACQGKLLMCIDTALY